MKEREGHVSANPTRATEEVGTLGGGRHRVSGEDYGIQNDAAARSAVTRTPHSSAEAS